jgi:cysteine peptidase C11 family protein
MKKWSVFVYICADEPNEDLVEAAIANVSEMRKVGSNDYVGIVAQLDLPAVPTKRYVFPANTGLVRPSEIDVIELDRNINSADPASIVDFFDWANRRAPAENIFLIMWGHGFGIDDFNPFLTNAAPPGTLGRSSEFGGFPDRNGPLPIVQTPIYDMTSGLPDQGRADFLKNNQIAEAVIKCRKSLPAGQNLAVLGFDACDMSLLEVWFEMTEGADIGIGSQYGIPYKGWPYTRILTQLLHHPEWTSQVLAKRVVEDFADFNDLVESKPVVTLSACNLSLEAEIANVIRPLAEALSKASTSASDRTKIFDARNESPIFDEDGFVDVESFCRLLQVNFPDSEIASRCEDVCKAVQKYVLAHSFAPKRTTKKISLSTGVSLWFPPWIQYPEIQILEKEQSEAYFYKHYAETKFAKLTGWDVFLRTILANTHFDAAGDTKEEESIMSNSSDDAKGSGVIGPTEGLGHTPPKGRTPPRGRTDPGAEPSSDQGGGRVFLRGSSREAGVVVRATVESFGPVGDTELQVTVKWPAGNNSSPIVDPERRSIRPPGGDANVAK